MAKGRKISEIDRFELIKRVADLNYNKNFSIPKIARQFNLSVPTIYALLQDAKEKGIVKIFVDHLAAPMKIPELSESLRDKIGVECLVIDCKRIKEKIETKFEDIEANKGYYKQKGEYEKLKSNLGKEEDDLIHEQLGRALTMLFLKKYIREEDVIGIGGGRGPYYTVRAFGDISRDMINVSDVKVISLHGNTNTTVWNREKSKERLIIDSDSTVLLFCQSIYNPIFYLVRKPLIFKIKGDTAEMKDPPYGERWNDMGKMNYSIIGIGNLTSGHRYMESIEHDKDAWFLDDIQGIENELKEIIQNKDKEPDIIVGDIVNRLFYIPPKNGSSQAIIDRIKKIKENIEKINKKLNIVNFERIFTGRTGKLFIVAGGRFKTRVLKAFFQPKISGIEFPGYEGSFNPSSIVKMLVTDDCTAKELLE
jgi:DNA-binding transcriptional regulator LsrR (DeoR family)